MSAAVAKPTAQAIEEVLIGGNLSGMSTEQRTAYYIRVCESLGLNHLTQPFAYITLNGKLVLYAKRDCTDQLRKLHRVSVSIVGRELANDVYVVTARATTPDGRCDEAIGAVAVGGLKGEALANCYMKTETKAKRRVTLSIVGLGWLDETEVADIPDARPVASQEPAKPALPSPRNTPGISKDQAGHLKRLLKEADVAWDQFREDFGVDRLSQLTEEQYTEACRILTDVAATKKDEAKAGNGTA